MRLEITGPAEGDLKNIVDYVALDNPAAAEKILRLIFDTAERLTDFPNMGRPGRLPETREFTLAGIPYVIVYHVAADTVTVVAVFHGARDLARALAERQNELSRQ